ncbi:MAG: sugar phosphate isomerase/epimerase family protein [Candidatus Latescibacterota bacterium]
MRAGVAGMFPLDLGSVDEAVARRIRDTGFTGVSAVIADPLSGTEGLMRRVRRVLADQGVRVAHANPLYESLVNPDEARRCQGVEALGFTCRLARWLGSDIVHVRPGSLNPRGHWLPYPGNTHPETLARLVRSLREVAPVAEGEGVYLALEGGIPSPLDSPPRVKEVIEATGSPAVRLNMDAVNFVGTLEDAYDSAAFLHRTFDLLASYVVCGHVKDLRVEESFILHINECAPGEGIFDLETFLRRFEAACPDGFLLIEHLPDDQVPTALRVVQEAARRAGVQWRE